MVVEEDNIVVLAEMEVLVEVQVVRMKVLIQQMEVLVLLDKDITEERLFTMVMLVQEVAELEK